MNRDERAEVVRGAVAVGTGVIVVAAIVRWLGWRFLAGLAVGAFADTALYGAVLLRERWRR